MTHSDAQRRTSGDWFDSPWFPSLFVTAFALAGIGLFVHAGLGFDQFTDALSYGGAGFFLVLGIAMLPPVRKQWSPTPMLGVGFMVVPLFACTTVWVIRSVVLL
jgi:hypothetical protein